MAVTECLDCGYELNLKTPKLGAKITCPECGSELEVVGLKPLELDWVYDDDDDEDEWDDDDED